MARLVHFLQIRTHVNNKNYTTTINNIVKIEQKIKKAKDDVAILEKLHSKLVHQKSKLKLYERNRNFDSLLVDYKFEVPEINIYEYIFKVSKKKLNKKIDKYILLKNNFYMAISILKNNIDKDSNITKTDIEYFIDFTENINKTYLNLIESRDELNLKYEQYNNEKLQKHMITIVTIVFAYLIYKIFIYLFTQLSHIDSDKSINLS